jgi:hypothetical protein
MIDMQVIGGVLTALAVLVGASIAISLALWASASKAHTGHTPNGGIRRDPPWEPEPDTDNARERELVLV